jgi:soluble lytic murein transglycosylase-like protein
LGGAETDGMTLKKRLQIGMFVLTCSAAIAAGAFAAPPQALSTTDAKRYTLAFDAADRGDFIDAEMNAAEIKDKSLLGYLSFNQLMHPTAHKASFDELAAWLGKFRDLPLAERVFALASKRKPDEAARLPAPVVKIADAAPAAFASAPTSSPERAREAREAFYSGDVKRALQLAPAAGDRWIAGLAAYRLKSYDQARTHFDKLATDEASDAWLRSAAAYWAGRSAVAVGDAAVAASYLQLAAQNPATFYGMIAERQLRLQADLGPASLVGGAASDTLMTASVSRLAADVGGFLKAEPRAHRAAALAQIGRPQEAGQELRAGLATARTASERQNWAALMEALGGPQRLPAVLAPTRRAADYDYPTPLLEPKSGFTIDKALVYAIVRQESRFNAGARSPVGAVGLMQLMPEAAARAAGDDKLKADMSPLLDPAFNLRVGQDYVTWLMERGVGYDILRTVAAYNGGPGTLLKTAQMLGDDADSLMIIECLPALETRNYVEKVMTAYWTYKRMWGEDAKTLDALAGGARFVDARLDLADARGPATQISSQPLQIGMR